MYHMSALAIGIALDLAIGDPHNLPHPIRAIGRLISALERRLYDDGERGNITNGAILWTVTAGVCLAVTAGITAGCYMLSPYAGAAAEVILTFYIMAAGSLRSECMKVYDKLSSNNAEGARKSLSMIVGRDTENLDEAGMIRAAVETAAENTSDGVIAPLVFTALFGPAGGMLYKAINTMDSMIGYNNEHYRYFGRTAAKADDIANFIPSRMSALFMITASFILSLFSDRFSGTDAVRIWKRDRRNHKSPNSAQTESVCAGALGVRLGGLSYYGGMPSEKPYIGDDTRPIENEDIRRSLALMNTAEIIAALVIFAMLFIVKEILR